MNSSLCEGQVRHRRFVPKSHEFFYQIFMPAVDLDELVELDSALKGFSYNRRNWMSLWRDDYIAGVADLKQAVLDKASALAQQPITGRVLMLANMRYIGFYFSPVNFYFIGEPTAYRYMIAEVSNTPWHEHHYYLVDLNQLENTEKQFHVSPFNPMDMHYQWAIKLNAQRVVVHIEAWREVKEFDATLHLQRSALNAVNLRRAMLRTPVMTIKIVSAIYWEAFKLFFIKRVPYYPHP